VQFAHAPSASAGGAGIFYDASLAVALIARPGNTEESLLKTHLALSMACGTGLRRGAWFSAVSATAFTGAVPRNLDFLFRAESSFFKGKGQIVAKVFSSAPSTPPPPSGTKKLSENVSEDIFESRRKVEAACKRTAITKGRMTELVVLSSFLRIGEDLISFGNVLEFFFCLFVAWVAIRVILQGELPVGFLDLVFASGAIYP
jgi:hypothetical protein